eukprot:10239943-Lingulodinium_polyedra.AAC.1
MSEWSRSAPEARWRTRPAVGRRAGPRRMQRSRRSSCPRRRCCSMGRKRGRRRRPSLQDRGDLRACA